MGQSIDRAKRKAAGNVCLFLYGLSNTLAYALNQMYATHPPSGEGLGAGLTRSEKDLVKRLAQRAADDGYIYRKLGWRLLGKKH